MDDDMAKQTNAEIKNNVIYEAKLMAGEGCLSTQDDSTKVKVSAPLHIDISLILFLTRLLRVTALALKFIDKLKGLTRSIPLDSKEIVQAEKLWTRYVQQSYYADVIDSIDKNKRNSMQLKLGIYMDNEYILSVVGD